MQQFLRKATDTPKRFSQGQAQKVCKRHEGVGTWYISYLAQSDRAKNSRNSDYVCAVARCEEVMGEAP